MPRPHPSAGLFVDPGSDDLVLGETAVRFRSRLDASKHAWDPKLGKTRAEADRAIRRIRADLGAYGEYLHGHTPARHHRLWLDLIQALIAGRLTEEAIGRGLLEEGERGRPRNKLLLLAPPASAKSSWCSIALPTWYLGNHPTHNVLFFTSSDPAATGFANTIKIILEHSEEHQQVFPDPVGQPHKARGWSTDGLFLNGTPMSGQTPAYRAVGFGASVMGFRSNAIIIDDPLNQEDALSPTEQAKAKRYYDMTLARRLQPEDGIIVAIMTRWAEGDLASYFIEKAEQSRDWLTVALPMLAEPGDPLGRELDEVLWPEQYPREWVERERAGMPAAEWACVFQAQAHGMTGGVFADERWIKPLPPDFFTRGEDGQSLRDQLAIFQGVDVAFSEKDGSSHTVILTLGLDRNKAAYILDVHRARSTVRQTEDAIVDRILAYEPTAVGLEDTAFKHAVTAQLVGNIRQRVMANIRAVAPRGMTKGPSDKVARARLPASRAEAGLMYADRSAAWWPNFISELLAFPRGKTNDQVDALSLATYLGVTFQTNRRAPKRLVFNPH